MSKVRFTINDDGVFEDRHGNKLGRITTVTVDFDPAQILDAHELALRAKLYERANNTCERCPNTEKLQMHHLTYERLGHELLTDVELLCRKCHDEEHKRLEALGTPLRRPAGGDIRGSSSGKRQSQEGGVGGDSLFDLPGAEPALSPAAVVWRHYQATIPGAGRRGLDSTRQLVIDKALKVRSAEECCRAIDGLAASPHHNGQNEQRKTYLDIQYALGMKSESPDERVDKMGAQAGKAFQATTKVADLLSGVPNDQQWIWKDRIGAVIAAHKQGRPDAEAERLVREKLGYAPVVDAQGNMTGWKKAA